MKMEHDRRYIIIYGTNTYVYSFIASPNKWASF